MTSEIDSIDFLRMWTTDASGNRVLAGLTLEETAFYVAYQQRRINDSDAHHRADRAEGTRFLELHDKHERVRLQVVCAEAERRENDPSIN